MNSVIPAKRLCRNYLALFCRKKRPIKIVYNELFLKFRGKTITQKETFLPFFELRHSLEGGNPVLMFSFSSVFHILHIIRCFFMTLMFLGVFRFIHLLFVFFLTHFHHAHLLHVLKLFIRQNSPHIFHGS
jgi:hypothetical protein